LKISDNLKKERYNMKKLSATIFLFVIVAVIGLALYACHQAYFV